MATLREGMAAANRLAGVQVWPIKRKPRGRCRCSFCGDEFRTAKQRFAHANACMERKRRRQ